MGLLATAFLALVALAFTGQLPRFLDRLTPDGSVWRLNWNLWDDPRLHQPDEDPDAASWDLPDVDDVGERVFLRVERQTLRRITADAVAFGIRVHQRPLARVAAQPGAVERLDVTLREMRAAHDAPGSSKKLGRLEQPVAAWVRRELARQKGDVADSTPPDGRR